MYFDLKKHNTSGITYKDDGQIPSSKIIDGKIVNTNSIPFTKPYKLQIRASKVIHGERSISKKTITFTKDITLLDAIKEAQKHYDQMMSDLENGISREIIIELNENSTFSEAWKEYLDYKVSQYASLTNKGEFDTHKAVQFYNKWLKPIHHKPLNKITIKDIIDIKVSMKRPDGTALAERTRRSVHQYVHPVYEYINTLPYIKVPIKSPASSKGLPPLQNERELNLTIDEIIEVFRQIRSYPVSPFREVFMWLMHGRRMGEVLSLEWKDIDLNNNIYEIPVLKNKARVNMQYILTPRLRATLQVLARGEELSKMKGYVFKSIKDDDKPLNKGTVRNHWDQSFVKHNLRKCIVEYLKNQHEVSDEICGYILGHKQNKSITQRYGKHGPQILSDKLNLMLDEIFEDEFSKKAVPDIDEKVLALQKLFPEKSLEQINIFLNI